MSKTITSVVSLIGLIFMIGCSSQTSDLEFWANGEAFATDAFLSVDGWQITFDRAQVGLTDVTAYQTDPPYSAASGAEPAGDSVPLTGQFTIDLHDAAADGRVLVGSVEAPIGHYNAITWSMGDGVLLEGEAQKDGRTIPFTLDFTDQTYRYACGEFVGDTRKGFVEADQSGELEMTFHFDHLFGNGDEPADDAVNQGALGFQPLADMAVNDAIALTLAQMTLSDDDYSTLLANLATLGHVGEGHCYEADNGYTGDKK